MRPELYLELGRYLERVKSVEKRVDGMEEDISDIRSNVSEIKTLISSYLWLAILYGSGLALSLSNDKAAEAIITLVKLYKGG